MRRSQNERGAVAGYSAMPSSAASLIATVRARDLGCLAFKSATIRWSWIRAAVCFAWKRCEVGSNKFQRALGDNAKQMHHDRFGRARSRLSKMKCNFS